MPTLNPEFISKLYPGSLKANVLKVAASQKDIDEVSNLGGYKNLARLDVSKNNIEDLKGIQSNQEITWLSVANNSLSSLEDIVPLTKLQVLNAGGNAISGKVDLTSLSHLKALILNHNRISRVSGLGEMTELNTVVLSHNRIQKLSSTLKGCTALSKLSVTHNQISDLGPALKSCTRLFELKVGHNDLEELPSSFSACYRLRILDLAGNKISSTASIRILQDLPFLRHLTLRGNPLCDQEGYRITVVEMLPNLESLDGVKIEGRHHGRHKDAMTDLPAARKDPRPEDKVDKVAKVKKAKAKQREQNDSDNDEVLDAAALGLTERSRGAETGRDPEAPFLDEVIAKESQRENAGKTVGNTGIVDVVQKKRKKRKNDGGGEQATGKKVVDLLLNKDSIGLGSDTIGHGGTGAWGAPISEWGGDEGLETALADPKGQSNGQPLKKHKTKAQNANPGRTKLKGLNQESLSDLSATKKAKNPAGSKH